MVTTRDEPGLRGLHLAQAIITTTEMWLRKNNIPPPNPGQHVWWREQIGNICRHYFAEADRTIEQLVRNAAEMAKAKTRSGIVTLPEPYLGNVIGPAGVPGERG